MNYRKLGKTGFEVSEISLGTWQVGGKWGDDFDHENARLANNLEFLGQPGADFPADNKGTKYREGSFEQTNALHRRRDRQIGGSPGC